MLPFEGAQHSLQTPTIQINQVSDKLFINLHLALLISMIRAYYNNVVIVKKYL